MAQIIRNVPAEDAQQALQDFKNLAAALGPLGKGAGARRVIRLLGDAHDPNARAFLRFLDDSALRWPLVLKKLAQQTSESQFRQTLAELRVLSHLNEQIGVEAQPARAAQNSKHHDIDATAGGVAAKIEIYSPSDVIDMPLFDQHIAPLFKFLDVPVGFHLEVALEPLLKGNAHSASDVGTLSQVERWLTRIREDAAAWIKASPAVGVPKSWDGPNKAVRLTVTIGKISRDRADRLVRYVAGVRPTDSRSFFDHGDPQQVRFSSWGEKVFDKMRKRQCGEYEPGKVRLLIVDFSGFDTSAKDFFRTTDTGIFPCIESALQIAATDSGAPIPYDGAVLAWADDPIVFAPAIALHPRAAADLQNFVSAAARTGALVGHM